MITTKLYGRLGNQMFQIANCIAHAVRHQQPYSIPRETTHPDKWPVYFTHFPPLTIRFVDFGMQWEQAHGYSPIPRREQICFDGYWQSYKYFADVLQIVLDSFAPAFNFPALDGIDFTGNVSIHIRRGDYVQLSTIHPPISLQYVKDAVAYFVNLGYGHFTIFSDDIPWCKANVTTSIFSQVQGEVFLRYMDTTVKDPVQDALFDMAAMARHEHNIISNSTFSLWAALLNKNPNKIVVTPALSNWFGPAYQHLDVTDLLPPTWVQMPANKQQITANEQQGMDFWCFMHQLCGERCQAPCGSDGKCEII